MSAFDRALIGRCSALSVVRVSATQLKLFARATAQPDPIYFDEAAARAAGHPTLPMPPTFAYSLTLAAPGQAGYGLVLVGADMRRILHAEQGFRYHRMIHAGDEVTVGTRLVDLYEKKGGALQFVVQRTELSDPDGAVYIECDTIFVVRGEAVPA